MADNDDDSEEARTLRPLQAASCTYRIALGPRAGQKVLTVQGAKPREKDFKQILCADISGFGLHAAVRCGADDRQALEQLCRHITRPALATERVQTNAAGQVVLKLKTPWRDGTTHLAMGSLEFMQRLAAQANRLHPALASALLSPLKGGFKAPKQATSRTAMGRLPVLVNEARTTAISVLPTVSSVGSGRRAGPETDRLLVRWMANPCESLATVVRPANVGRRESPSAESGRGRSL